MSIPFLPGVKVIAVVGASRNPEKWGYKVFVTLRDKFPGVRVYPINPKAKEIAGSKAYPSLKDLPEKPDLVVTVVPPQITEKIVEEAKKLGIKMIWMQPGSESDKAIEEAEKSGMKVYHHTCIVQSSEAGKIIPFKLT